ncbi:hypothetical protein EFW17_20480 [Halostreptopolyspora alba]|uniref:DDE Tnp4 domain-containing protein n=1 Tax=Halostreptopolyspora alba TaxID=2487137 RepID=A0A3N0E2T4_9ACTN|nr:hypothetical protein EFW17_20480 [Nocardiopsaceae bacterium YIM 96095]
MAIPPLPVAVYDIRVARTHGIIGVLANEDVACWVDKCYRGAGGTVMVPFRGSWENLSAGQRPLNRSHAKIRALGEQAVATLKHWRLLDKLRCSPAWTTVLVRAILTLHLTNSIPKMKRAQ